MKKILRIILLLGVLFSFSQNITAYNIVVEKKEISKAIKKKMTIFLNVFYKKMDKKTESISAKINVLRKVIVKIEKLKKKKSNMKKWLMILNFLQKEILTKIEEYKIWEKDWKSSFKKTFNYDSLRKKCKSWHYGCFYFIALLEAEKILLGEGEQCPTNYRSVSRKEIWSNFEIKELKDLSYCKKEIKKDKGISKQQLDIIKDKLLHNPNECYNLNLVDVKQKDNVFKDELIWLALGDFDEKYKLMKLEWKISCFDVPYQEDKVVFFSQTENKYYLLDDHKLEYFLKWWKSFLVQKMFVFLWEEEHDIFHNRPVKRKQFSDKSSILKLAVKNSLWKLQIIDYDLWHKWEIFVLTPSAFENIWKLKEKWLKYNYKMKNKYRWNLFLAYTQKITSEAKNVCQWDNSWKIEKSDLEVYILEIWDNFDILNKEMIYSEKWVEKKVYCRYLW